MNVLWEDRTALVIDKPAGLLSAGPPGIDSLETSLRAFLHDRDKGEASPYLGLAHRLDRPVSGAILIGRTVSATRLFGAQFQAGRIEKEYLACVSGVIPTDAGTWTDMMRKIPSKAKAELTTAEESGGKQAVLHYRVIRRGPQQTLLAIRLETGRMHQIRLQLASRGFPILGDALYGAWESFGTPVDDPREQPIALHSRSLRFHHPKTAKTVKVVSPLPPVWQSLPSTLVSALPSETTAADG